jgi:hypothetical protein
VRQRTPQLYARLERRTSTALSCQLSSPRAATATVAEQGDELAPFQLSEWHSLTRHFGAGLQDIEWAKNSQRVYQLFHNSSSSPFAMFSLVPFWGAGSRGETIGTRLR